MEGDQAWQKRAGLPGFEKRHGSGAAGLGVNYFPPVEGQGVFVSFSAFFDTENLALF